MSRFFQNVRTDSRVALSVAVALGALITAWGVYLVVIGPGYVIVPEDVYPGLRATAHIPDVRGWIPLIAGLAISLAALLKQRSAFGLAVAAAGAFGTIYIFSIGGIALLSAVPLAVLWLNRQIWTR